MAFFKKHSSDKNKVTDFVKTYEKLKPFFALLVHCLKHIEKSEDQIQEKIERIKRKTGQDINQDLLQKELWVFRYACLHMWYFDLLMPKNETELSDQLLVINSALKSVLTESSKLEYSLWLKEGFNKYSHGDLDIKKLEIFMREFSSNVSDVVTRTAFESTGGRLAGELHSFVIELFMTTMQLDKKVFHMNEGTELNELEDLDIKNLLTDLDTNTRNEAN